MSLVERDDVEKILDRRLDESGLGRGATVLLSGPLGSGKTALLQAFGERATASGALFLSAMGSHTERALPLGVMQQLFHNAGQSLPEAEPVRRAGDVGGLGRPAGRGGERPADDAPELWHDACRTLLELADMEPVVIGIDDVECADGPSLRCLLYVMHRIRSARVMVVLTETIGLAPTDPFLRAELIRQPRCQRVRLPLLSQAGVGLLLARELDLPAAHRMVPAVHAATGGAPFLVRALIEDNRAAAGNRAAADLVAGTAFSQAVLTCLYRCEPDMVRVAHAVAVLGESGSPAAVARLAGTDTKTATQSIDALTLAGLLRKGTFRHPAARSAVLDFVTVDDRAQFHCRAAELLHGDGAAPAAVAEQLVAAAQVHEPWAIAMLRQAGQQALADGKPSDAVEYVKLAHASCADEGDRLELEAMLADAASLVNRTTAVRHLPSLLAAARDGRLASQHVLLPVRLLITEGRVEDATDVLRRLADRVGELDPRTRAESHRLSMCLAYLFPAHAGQIRPLTETLTPSPDAAAALHLLPGYATPRHETDDVVAAAEQVLQNFVSDNSSVGLLLIALSALIYSGRLNSASSWINYLLNEAYHRGAVTWQGFLAAVQAAVSLRRGDLEMAEKQARTALRLVPRHDWGVAVGAPVTSLVLATTASGRHEDAARELSRPVPEVMFQTPIGLFYLRARAQHYLAINRPQAALVDLQTCGRLTAEWGLDRPAMLPWRSDAARAWLQRGRPDEARRLVEEQMALTSPTDLRTHGISLRVLAATSNLRQRPRLLTEAAAALQRSADRLNLAYVLADLSRAHRALGETAQANTLGRQAQDMAKQCQAEPERQRLVPKQGDRSDVRVAAAPDPEPVGTALSSAERRVASLAARGFTNREIASKLYITVSTVEQHLTRVYRKLKVNRRVDLRDGLESGLLESA